MLCIKGVHFFFLKHLQDIFTTVVTKKKNNLDNDYKFCISYLIF